MDYRRLGSTGVRVSELCLGTWRFGKETGGVVETDREAAHDLLDAAWQLTKALWISDMQDLARFEVTQPLHHAGYYEDVSDYLDVCADQNLAVCPYSPLAGGFLTGKYERADPEDPEAATAPDGTRGSFDDAFGDYYLSERGWKVLDEIRSVADEVDATPAQVALRWVMDWDAFTCVPIVGARTTEQLAENVAATEVSLSDDQWERIMDARYNSEGDLWH